MQMTSNPNSEKHAPETRPTYPVPMTAIFTILIPMIVLRFDNRQTKFVQSQISGGQRDSSQIRVLAFFMAKFHSKVT